MATNFQDDVVLNGTVNAAGATNFHHKAGSILNAAIGAAAGIDYSKLDTMDLYVENFGLNIDDAPAVHEPIVAVARSAGTIRFFYAGLYDTGTSTDLDFDLNVNGSSVLSAVVNVDHGDADRANVAGAISSATLAAGNVISVSLEDIVSSTGALGPFAVVGVSYESTPA